MVIDRDAFYQGITALHKTKTARADFRLSMWLGEEEAIIQQCISSPILSRNELFLRVKLPCYSLHKASYELNGKQFLASLKELEKGDIHLEAKGKFLVLHEQTLPDLIYQVEARPLPAKPKPLFPSKLTWVKLDFQAFKHLYHATIFAISDDETRLFLNGIYLQLTANQLLLVGTDGKRMAVDSMTLATKATREEQAGIIAPQFFTILDKFTNYGDKKVAISLDSERIYAKFGKVAVSCPKIDGTFVAYQRAIPDYQKQQVQPLIMNRQEALEAIQKVAKFADAKAKRIYCQISEKTVTFLVQEQKESSISQAISYQGEAKSMLMAFNHTHLSQALNSLLSDAFAFYYIHPDKAIEIRAHNHQQASLHIIMTMQVDEKFKIESQ